MTWQNKNSTKVQITSVLSVTIIGRNDVDIFSQSLSQTIFVLGHLNLVR